MLAVKTLLTSNFDRVFFTSHAFHGRWAGEGEHWRSNCGTNWPIAAAVAVVVVVVVVVVAAAVVAAAAVVVVIVVAAAAFKCMLILLIYL